MRYEYYLGYCILFSSIEAFFSPSKCPHQSKSISIGFLAPSFALNASAKKGLKGFCADELPKLKSGSDIRGQYCSDDEAVRGLDSVAQHKSALITPTISYCLGFSFARMVQAKEGTREVSICVGRDPRDHGIILSKYCCMGAEAAGAKVLDTGLATTPSLFEFCRSDLPCDGGVMVTASHLPVDRNGMKFFTKEGGYSNDDIMLLVEGALAQVERLNISNDDRKPSFSMDSHSIKAVNFMPYYAKTLKDAIMKEVSQNLDDESISNINLPLTGLKITLNAGGGAGYFFNEVLHELGADVSSSIGIVPDSEFPNGVPNPEDEKMVKHTIASCEEFNADIGIMLDTDADRCGFVIPRTVLHNRKICRDYEPLNRNRLIALLGVIFSSYSPGCSIVTDSVTSEGLTIFLENDLGLSHVRYLKGYANVINKAKELTSSGIANAEMAIETSGHCAMKENGYLDDGTYTAVKIIGLLARIIRSQDSTGNMHKHSLLDLIKDLKEMSMVDELRMNVIDGTIASTTLLFDLICDEVLARCISNDLSWSLDTENLEGIRVRTTLTAGGFFMLRKSLHDPIISLQIEADNAEQCCAEITSPLRDILSNIEAMKGLDLSVLNKFDK